ncbi:tyrosine-type recombinase/integrase [Tsukamurella pulmonis]|uniref:tyrosine-type recombinase/integrase n=1 Tax=Tsukamurella pulmonis TaxID=47312 RepID=UPI000E090B73|nr:site-specific integrase [Tsukamurella pulmonis]RDH13809.1 site-specific integrase [Tsukamurella pulmonis]
MTVVAFAPPEKAVLAASQQSWGEFVAASLNEQPWRPDEWDPDTYLFIGSLKSAQTGISTCLREGCEVLVDGDTQLCAGCRKAKVKLPPGGALPPRSPHGRRSTDPGAAARFSLAALAPDLRNEIVYGLQDRDRQQLAIRPMLVRRLVKYLPAAATTLLDLDDTRYTGMPRALLRSLQQALRRLELLYRDEDGTEGDVWDCALVGLASHRGRSYVAVTGTLNFTAIRQQWLRDLTRDVLRSLRPNVQECKRYIQAAELASVALSGRRNGNVPERLSAGDMAEICRVIAGAINPRTGGPYSVAHSQAIIGWWRRLTDHARGSGLMDQIPGTFVVRPGQTPRRPKASEDDLGRAIPEEWTAHLDRQLHLLGTTSSFTPKGWHLDDVREMYRVFYQVLRDTGRRPSEIGRLTDNPVEYVRGQPSLIYDNMKAGRHRRRLPIDMSTANIIEAWRQRVQALYVPIACVGYLFPALGGRNKERSGHLNPSQFRRIFNAWVEIIAPPQGLSERAVAFRAEDLELYGFRHAYAQRHADNGTPVDVLRDLMDHREIDTTMGYYQVTLTRKQKAVALVSQMAVDREGTAAPFASELAYERASVATAYGNCTEPSNVKAGGQSCPIRFQCSGCSFYRSDPSYLAAIEQQIAQLRADRAVARTVDAASWVIDNLDAQIRSYEQVAHTMREQLANLPESEQASINSACTDLRKARQAALIPADSLRRRLDADSV